MGHHLYPDGGAGFVYLAVVLDWFSRPLLIGAIRFISTPVMRAVNWLALIRS